MVFAQVPVELPAAGTNRMPQPLTECELRVTLSRQMDIPSGNADQLPTSAAIERIEHQGRALAIILRAEYQPASIEFLTSDQESLQLGVMQRPKGYVIQPHVHKPVRRTVDYTYEVLFIARGRVEVTFFSDARELVTRRELRQGDCVMLMTGGHGFRMLEDCKMIEAKQGPYAGTDFDKFRFDP